MVWPTTPIPTANLDAGTDSPATARADLLQLAQQVNQLQAHVSAFATMLLDDVDAASMRGTLGAAADAAVLKTTGDQTAVGNKTFSGYTKLGSGAPALQCKKLTGTTVGAEGFGIDIPHLISDVSKVVGVSVMVYDSFNAAWIHAGYTTSTERQFDWRLTATDLRISNSASNSGSILSAPFKALLWVEE